MIRTWTDADVAVCFESAVREVLSDPTLSSADLVGILEDLVPAAEPATDTRHTGDAWTAPMRWLRRGTAGIGFGQAGERCCFLIRLPKFRSRPLWPQSDAENDRLNALIRGDL